MAKNQQHRQFLALAGNFFKPITTIETLSNYFYLVEEVLSLIWWVICENLLTIGFRNAIFHLTRG